MYLTRQGYTYYAGTEQRHTRAPFLLLFSGADSKTVYAAVRKVALRQLGHWMMGSANVDGYWITVSGAYGNDGLTISKVGWPSDAVRLPDDLRDAWANGGGWNSAGSEAEAMRDWARKTFRLD